MSNVVKGANDEITLHIWGGGWGLPSIDPASLQCLANIRFAGVPVQVIECNNPWKSPNGRIPFLEIASSKEFMYSPNEISAYLRLKNYSADYGLSSVECSETLAYMEYVWDTLHIAYQYYAWIQPSNFDDTVRPFIGKRLPWMYKMWYPERIRKRAIAIVTSVYREGHLEFVERFIVQKVQDCIRLLSDKLGNKEFFLGKAAPTTMDSVIFSYLSFFWKVPLPHNPIKELIKSSPNLETYLARILQRYFPVSSRRSEGQTSSRSTYGLDGELITSDDSTEYPVSHKIFMMAFTAALMLWYGYKNKIVRLPLRAGSNVNPPDEDDEYWEEA